MLVPATPMISGFTPREMPWELDPPERVGGVTETTICVGGKGVQLPLNPHQRGDTLL